ncbi:MAG: TRAM domain-containing protein, partial [Acidobacteriaceae bacterium]
MKLLIEKAVYGGSGLSHDDGKAVFVPFTLPGETVEAEIVADKGGFSTAELQSVLEPSPARTQPPCPYFGQCGGCHYQHAIYEA